MRITRRSVLSTLAGAAAASVLRPHRGLAQTEPSLDGHDPLRPSFHYLPARNWINDPCGPIFFRGQYHLFHQYNPHAAVWGDMHWAHATSPDMVHWTRLPVALSPTPGGPDSEGVFTGSALLQHDGTPAFIYTGVQSVPHAQATLSDGTHNFRETQLLATASDPDLRTWTKRPQPVIPSPPPGLTVTGFRDPAPFVHDGTQYLIVGSGQRGIGGMAFLYRARKLPNGTPDLTQWEYLHPLTQDTTWQPPAPSNPPHTDPVDTGEMWECPDFFQLGDRHVLLYSTRRQTLWQVGDLDPETLSFHATASGQLDLGHSFYAPKSQLDRHGNRILWGWLNETRPEAEFSAAGWAGMISLPRTLTVEDDELTMRPLPALQQLRRPSLGGPVNEYTAALTRKPEPQSWEQANVPQLRRAPSIRDTSGPLLTFQTSQNNDLLLTGPDFLPVTFDASHFPDPADLHIFFDHSVLELFIAGKCFTYRFYHRAPDTAVLTLHLPKGLFAARAQTHTLQSIWPA